MKLDNSSCEVLETVLSRVQTNSLDLEKTNLEDEVHVVLILWDMQSEPLQRWKLRTAPMSQSPIVLHLKVPIGCCRLTSSVSPKTLISTYTYMLYMSLFSGSNSSV